jgi:folate-dependent phosphoribosylglycinamide formyltransferase PurN
MLKRGASPSPLRVAVLCSQRAPAFAELVAAQESVGFKIVGVIASDPASAVVPDTAGSEIPCMVYDIQEFYREENAPLSDLTMRPLYDTGIASLLQDLGAELVVLSGYLHVLTVPVLEAFPTRVINIHDSDLILQDPEGRPRYRGLHSTRDAIAAGETETRSTVHLVSAEVDTGPPLVRSWSFPVHSMMDDAREWNAAAIIRAYAYAQREWMMRAAWGELLVAGVTLFVEDRLRLLGSQVYLGGEPAPITLERPRCRRDEPWRALAGH